MIALINVSLNDDHPNKEVRKKGYEKVDIPKVLKDLLGFDVKFPSLSKQFTLKILTIFLRDWPDAAISTNLEIVLKIICLFLKRGDPPSDTKLALMNIQRLCFFEEVLEVNL